MATSYAGVVLDPFVLDHVIRADELVQQLLDVSAEVSRTYETERYTFVTLQRAQDALEAEVNSALADLDFMAAMTKEGPLAGIARTSDTYKMVMRKQRAELLAGPMRHIVETIQRGEDAYQQAQSRYEAAKVHFQALRTIADLSASVLGVLK